MPRTPQARLHDGQIYRPIAVDLRSLPSGGVLRIFTWETRCPDCWRWFTFENAIGFPKHPRRRCDDCRKPGVAAGLPPRHKPPRYRNVGRKRRATS